MSAKPLDEELNFYRRELDASGDHVSVDLWYPRLDVRPIKAVHVGLMDVRAADDIRIEYDYERDGWAVKQAQAFQWGPGDEECDPKWVEVAFVQAWASQKRPADEEDEEP